MNQLMELCKKFYDDYYQLAHMIHIGKLEVALRPRWQELYDQLYQLMYIAGVDREQDLPIQFFDKFDREKLPYLAYALANQIRRKNGGVPI